MTWKTILEGSLLSPAQHDALVKHAQAALDGKLALAVIRDREKLQAEALAQVRESATALHISLPRVAMMLVVDSLVGRIGGLSIFHKLMPPVREDLDEIMVNPDGSIWLVPSGQRDAVLYDYQPGEDEIWRAVEALLAPLGRSISRATPLVDAKLPRMAGMGGARVSMVHNSLAPGRGYPSINIRLFKPKPVTLEQLHAWDVAPPAVLQALLRYVAQGYRILTSGGTATGKTTLLSGLSNGIPKNARVVKIEDPEEIWLDHPHVVTLEARPTQPGSQIEAITARLLVDKALRMSPRWLIVGEVRTGDVANALFRAQMSDHPGLSTFHATDPWHAVHRMALIMFADEGIRFAAAKDSLAKAVDLIVQIGWLGGRRQIVGIWAVLQQLKAGEVQLEDVYLAEGYRVASDTSQIDKIKQIFEAAQAGQQTAQTDAKNLLHTQAAAVGRERR